MKSWSKYTLLKLTILAVLLLILFFELFLRYQGKVIGVTEDTPANNVRALLTAVGAYEAKYNSLPPSLSSLGPPPKGEEANRNAASLIDSRLALGNKNGYVFRYLPNGQSKTFFITADPSGNGSPASVHFFSDQTGVVRVESAHAATGSSQPYNGDN